MSKIFNKLTVLLLFFIIFPFVSFAEAGGTACTIEFSMKRGSATSEGTGNISCTNGQKATVKLKGQGHEAGKKPFEKGEVLNGQGAFTNVTDLNLLYGVYERVEANDAVGSTQLVNKGEVALTLMETNKEIDLDLIFKKLTISKK